MSRRLNVPVADLSRLERMAGERRFLGHKSSDVEFLLFRDTYFDTPDAALRREGMSLRLRAQADGRQVVQLSIVSGVNLQGVADETLLETPVVGAGLYSTLRAESEVATRVRSMALPESLRPRLALDVDREVRELRRGLWGRAAFRVSFDQIIAHTAEGSRASQEVTLRQMDATAGALESLAEGLIQYGAEADGQGTYERLLQSLIESPELARVRAPTEVQVAPVILVDGRVALIEGPDGLCLPTARGSGERLVTEFVGEFVGSEASSIELDLVGFAQPGAGRPDLEVWLYGCPPLGTPVEGLVWIPLGELMQRVGAPGLLDPGLRAALILLVRNQLGQAILKGGSLGAAGTTFIEADDRPGQRYLDLELSILDFNQRVLELAEDPAIPLLERFFFLSVFSSNMDEFFVVRVGRLKDAAFLGRDEDAAMDGVGPADLVDLIAIRVRALMARQEACLTQMLLPELASRGVRLRQWGDLTSAEQQELAGRFEREIFPLLTPLSLTTSPGRSFPRVPSLGLSLAAVLRRPELDRTEFGYVPVSDELPRFLEIRDSSDLIATTDVIAANAHALFPSTELQGVYGFRVSRMSDVEIDEDSSGSLLAAVADEVEARPFKPVIRIEVDSAMPREVRAFLLKELRAEPGGDSALLTRADVYEVEGTIDPTAFSSFLGLDVEGGRFPPYEARNPIPADASIFDVLTDRDLLVHHPYESFAGSVARFLREAAEDPHVVSIKLTLYRTGRDSPVLEALLAAREAGKEVTVFVELKARFDEESNIEWTRRLTAAGAHVVYGVVGYKTHAKTTLVVRKEEGGLRRYVHIGTGNYNATTARFYGDVGLFSADPDLGADLHDFFNELTGSAGPPETQFRRLLVAPNSLVQGLLRLTEREIAHARAGRPARIQAKLNGLADREVVDALYDASQAGVKVDLIVRSICTLRPGVPGLSEGITVRSLLGRFLEHARVVYFENAGQGDYYIGSADWRARNLRRRVEVLTPVDDPEARRVLRHLLDAQLADPRAWVMRADGAFERLTGEGPSAQEVFMAGDAPPDSR